MKSPDNLKITPDPKTKSDSNPEKDQKTDAGKKPVNGQKPELNQKTAVVPKSELDVKGDISPKEEIDQKTDEIVKALEIKAGTKQFIFRKTIEIFNVFKQQIALVASEVGTEMKKIDGNIGVSSHDNGAFEAELKFSGDTLMFMMHTNVFNFPPDSEVFKTKYVKEDPLRAYCGMILIYDFLSDSIKYGRMNDIGYLIARIFINKEGHFFVQGKRQFSFLYNDFTEFEINPEIVRLIVQTAILHTIDFDLFVPPFDEVKEVSLMQKIMEAGSAALKTGKRLGFNYQEPD